MPQSSATIPRTINSPQFWAASVVSMAFWVFLTVSNGPSGSVRNESMTRPRGYDRVASTRFCQMTASVTAVVAGAGSSGTRTAGQCSARCSCEREVMPSLGNARYRCATPVRWMKYRRASRSHGWTAHPLPTGRSGAPGRELVERVDAAVPAGLAARIELLSGAVGQVVYADRIEHVARWSAAQDRGLVGGDGATCRRRGTGVRARAASARGRPSGPPRRPMLAPPLDRRRSRR